MISLNLTSSELILADLWLTKEWRKSKPVTSIVIDQLIRGERVGWAWKGEGEELHLFIP